MLKVCVHVFVDVSELGFSYVSVWLWLCVLCLMVIVCARFVAVVLGFVVFHSWV